MDGGRTWTLLDSTDNTKPFAQRDHAFVGTTGYKVVVDPVLSPQGQIIVYAALSDNTSIAKGGIWVSRDGGLTWTNGQNGTPGRGNQATDVLLDLTSVDAVNHNVQKIYATFRGEGVFQSPNQGTAWNLLTGGAQNPNIRDGDFFPNPPAIPV